ncbi:EthD domain-containing protein (plasmid) [Rhizobium lusitanum]|uniref:EthD domain-containing protein n=1 Tax=Rhizobium lusitanum TaxID=293958 RepID=UPI00161712C0|nr:EthD domain-containing protein [Rhizobium lusitanum]QND44411.1 EthD domain-containing protein [Rhizobium lusitanum]
MYTVAFIFKRKPGLPLDEFLAYYRDSHGPLMISLIKDKGLISYEHLPVDTTVTDGRYVADDGPAFDAISVYSFGSKEEAEACWAIPEVIADSAAFIDFDTMVTLPANRRTVFPV